MKTFDEKDLITWANRNTVKVGDEGYFANNITDLNKKIKAGRVYELMSISDNYNWCFTDGTFRYGFFLPKDAVKENKTYRACRNVKDVYKLVYNSKCEQLEDRFCISQLLVAVIHFKQKGFDTTYYEYINGIVEYNNGDIAVHIGGANFELDELFKKYEIEINGEWQPFGVLEE